MEHQIKTLTVNVYFDFQYQELHWAEADIWCSQHKTCTTREEALAAAVEFQQRTGCKTRLIQVELYRSVL